ncbi:MAG: hypothetical protein JNL62_22245 [Bryobacterales bacterium]|nr:hypothetical protein [Bryobacterales bacterium]
MQETGPDAETATRQYVLMAQSNTRAKINASQRLPYYTSGKGETKEVHTAALGSIIECIPQEKGSAVRLDCSLESSHVAATQPSRQPPVGFLPVVIARQASVTAMIPIGQEVPLVRMDDPTSNNRLDIFVSIERLAAIP